MATGAQSSSVDFSSAQDSVREHAKDVLSAHRNEIHRSLQVEVLANEQCKTESEAIYLDSSFISAYAAYEEQAASTVSDHNCVESGINRLTCNFDYAKVEPSNLKSICASLSGQDNTFDLHAKCTFKVKGQNVFLFANYYNVYDCLGASCDPASLSAKIEKFGAEIDSVFQSQGITCKMEAISGSQ